MSACVAAASRHAPRCAAGLLSLLAASSVNAQAEPVAPDSSPEQTLETAAAPAASPGALHTPPSAANASTLLALGEEAMTTLDYPYSRELARAAIAKGKLDVEGLTRAYRLIAVSSAQLGDDPGAKGAFIRLFALEPDSNIWMRLAPVRRSAVLDARGFWSVRHDGFGIDVAYARRDRQIAVRVRDPLDWVKTVHVWFRFSDRPYVKAVHAAATEVLFDVDEIGPTDPIEIYAYASDEHDNVLQQFARERDPHLFGLSDEELEEFLRRDIRGGQPGSFALRLAELGVDVGVHGYLSLELKPIGNVASFDLHHATAMIRASFQNSVSLEIALEWEHLGIEHDDFYLPHGFMDLRFAEGLILRAGLFEVPVGAFNEYLYPDFLRITGQAPELFTSVIPGLWSEVGVQLRGRFMLAPTAQLTYAAFVVNGLEQADDKPHDGMVQEGGDIRAMRFNARDQFSGDKALGGRAGLELGPLDLGVSGYSGRYTIDAERRLSMADVDLSFRNALLTVRAEGAIAWQEITGGQLRKYGLYTLAALRPLAHLEPYAQYDFVNVGRWAQRALLGFALYPFPAERSTRNLRLKSEAGFDFAPASKAVFIWFFQLTTGF